MDSFGSGKKILIVEDTASIRGSLMEMLSMADYTTYGAATGEEGVKMAKQFKPNLILTDLKLPGINGIEVIKEAKELDANTPCIVMTAYATIETAVDAMKVGAYTYLTKPVKKQILCETIKNALISAPKTVTHREDKKTTLKVVPPPIDFIGITPEIVKVKELVAKVAPTDSTVLILGESGTGKEIIAKSLHSGHNLRDEPFVAINCGAIPSELLESELFGHEKGAFTGADSQKKGSFEMAGKGTLFLDEIGEMPLHLQVKLLRVLQEKEIIRVGSTVPVKVHARVVAATNQNLKQSVANKTFREDLYYRLNVIPVTLPPLRERKRDIPLLLTFFIEKQAAKKSKNISGVSQEAVVLLEQYQWPGNIREMENLIEQIVVLKTEGEITKSDLPEHICKLPPTKPLSKPLRDFTASEGIDFNKAVEDFEKDLIIAALERVDGVKKQAADYLKINRTTLIEKMKRKGLIS